MTNSDIKSYKDLIVWQKGSELETQLFLCKDLYALDVKECIMLLEEVSKILRVIISKLEPRT